MIVRSGSKIKVKSHTTGRTFGTYSNTTAGRKQAQKRLRQMAYYKHAANRSGY